MDSDSRLSTCGTPRDSSQDSMESLCRKVQKQAEILLAYSERAEIHEKETEELNNCRALQFSQKTKYKERIRESLEENLRLREKVDSVITENQLLKGHLEIEISTNREQSAAIASLRESLGEEGNISHYLLYLKEHKALKEKCEELRMFHEEEAGRRTELQKLARDKEEIAKRARTTQLLNERLGETVAKIGREIEMKTSFEKDYKQQIDTYKEMCGKIHLELKNIKRQLTKENEEIQGKLTVQKSVISSLVPRLSALKPELNRLSREVQVSISQVRCILSHEELLKSITPCLSPTTLSLISAPTLRVPVLLTSISHDFRALSQNIESLKYTETLFSQQLQEQKSSLELTTNNLTQTTQQLKTLQDSEKHYSALAAKTPKLQLEIEVLQGTLALCAREKKAQNYLINALLEYSPYEFSTKVHSQIIQEVALHQLQRERIKLEKHIAFKEKNPDCPFIPENLHSLNKSLNSALTGISEIKSKLEPLFSSNSSCVENPEATTNPNPKRSRFVRTFSKRKGNGN